MVLSPVSPAARQVRITSEDLLRPNPKHPVYQAVRITARTALRFFRKGDCL